MELEARKAVLYSIFDAGVRAVAPDAALMRHVCLEDGQLLVDGQSWKLPRRGRLLVLGAGKGVAPMGAAVEELLGDRIDTGMLVVKYGHGLPLQQIAQVEAAHPVPDAAGAAATRALLELAAGATADDLVLCLLTGGASALTPAPVSGVTLEDMQQVTELLLRSGATITELNAVRKHLSRFSGGQLARTAAPCRGSECDRFRCGRGRPGCHRLRPHSAGCFDVRRLHGHPRPLRAGIGHAARCPAPSPAGPAASGGGDAQTGRCPVPACAEHAGRHQPAGP